jgi:DNA end-binding protein Ku
VAIRPEADVLALETMYFADEVRSPTNELPNLPGAEVTTEQELQMANLLINSMESEWEPQRYHDTHRAKVEALIEEKAQGKTIAVAKAPQATKVVDLMEALSASIKAKSGPAKASSRTKASSPAKTEAAPRARVTRVPAAKKATKAPVAKSARRKAS